MWPQFFASICSNKGSLFLSFFIISFPTFPYFFLPLFSSKFYLFFLFSLLFSPIAEQFLHFTRSLTDGSINQSLASNNQRKLSISLTNEITRVELSTTQKRLRKFLIFQKYKKFFLALRRLTKKWNNSILARTRRNEIFQNLTIFVESLSIDNSNE